jgi:hypothetical protein
VIRKTARLRRVARAPLEDTSKQIRVCKLLRGLISVEGHELPLAAINGHGYNQNSNDPT